MLAEKSHAQVGGSDTGESTFILKKSGEDGTGVREGGNENERESGNERLKNAYRYLCEKSEELSHRGE